MDAPTVIKLDKITKTYKLYHSQADRVKETFHPFKKLYHHQFNALKNISLDVKKGESIGVIGKNGSGKTTLLQIVAGISEATHGSVETHGNIAALLMLGAGFNPAFTGKENIFLNAAILGLAHNEIIERYDDIVKFADIGEFINQPVKTYSSGMYIRLAFAVAIHVDPDILIVDEALAVGDELFQRKCYTKIQQFLEDGNSIVFVSHNLNTVNEICRRTILLDKGELLLDGPSKLVTNQYQRYIYATASQSDATRNEIQKLNLTIKHKHEVGPKNTSFHPIHDKELQQPIVNETEKSIEYFTPEYLPKLQSKTRIEYKNYDVDIEDIHLRTLDGKMVNRLVMGDDYIYSYKVTFNVIVEKIHFGMMITNDKGIMITGRRTKVSDNGYSIDKVNKGDSYLLEWFFHCSLVPNLYYLNVGVESENIENKFLNRVVDAIAFEVKKNNSIQCGGLVDLIQKVHIKKVLDSE
jgi:lipopolysaccharide transport system ATP-binding protein